MDHVDGRANRAFKSQTLSTSRYQPVPVVAVSNPGSPTKFLKDLQRPGPPQPGLWSPKLLFRRANLTIPRQNRNACAQRSRDHSFHPRHDHSLVLPRNDYEPP